MARLTSIGFELDTLTNGVEITTNNFGSGTAPTIVTSPVLAGGFAMKHTASATNSSCMYQFSSGGIGVAFIRVWFYVPSVSGYPTANCTILDLGTAAAAYGGIFMNSSGQLGINYNVGTTSTYDTVLSSAVSQDTWHYLDLKIDTSTANSQVVTGMVDGTLINTKTGTRTLAANSLTLGVWGTGLRESSTFTIYSADIAINNNTGSFQNSYVGNSRLIRLSPNAAGDSNSWKNTTQGAGSTTNYTLVDEVTPDGGTTNIRTHTLNATDMYNVTDSGLGSGDTVNVVSVGAVFNDAAADAVTAFKLQIEKTSGGTIAQSATIIPNTTTFNTNATSVPKNYPLVLYQDPDGSDWTNTTVDSMQIGAIITAAGTNDAKITTIWAYVDYTPSSGTTTTQTQTGVSRISAITAKTQTGVSRITATTQKTQTGKATLITGASRTQTGKANIKVTTAKTQTGVARVGKTVSRTQTGVANIVAASLPPNTPTLSTPTDTSTGISLTPTLNFSTTDPNSDDVSYELQVATTNTFSSGGGTVVNHAMNAHTSAMTLTSQTAGNANLVFNYNGTGSAGTMSDSAGNTYTLIGSETANSLTVYIWLCSSIVTSSSNTITLNGSTFDGGVYEISGLSGTVDTFVGGNSSTSLNITTANANEMIISFVAGAGTGITAGSGYSNFQSATFGAFGEYMQTINESTAGTYSTNFTGAVTGGILIAIALESAGGSVIDAVSASGGHDSGQFTDVTNGADTDPFASGNSINFVVPSAEILTASTTYYWRVRAKDPVGTNTFSGWSSPFSFVTGAGSVTTDQTQTGVARITATTLKTQTGKSRITATTTKTQSGVSRITIVTARTQTGKSRIIATTTKNQSGVTRIAATTTHTQTGKSRITITTPQSQTGKANLKVTTLKTQSGVANIKATTNKTQNGTARITATTTKVQTGVSRIGLITLRTQTGITRITATKPQVQTGKSRITAITVRTQVGVANIKNTTTRAQTGKGNINVATVKTQTGVSRVTASTSRTQSGVARITIVTTRTQTGVGRVQLVKTVTTTGIARITAQTARTQVGLSRITATTARTQTGKSRVTITTTKTQTGKSRITQVVPKTVTGLSRITATTPKAQTGKANIATTTKRTQTGVANIVTTSSTSRTQTGISRITATSTQTQTGKSSITVTVIKTITGKSRLTIQTSKVQTGKSRITATTSHTQTALSRITAIAKHTITGIGRISQIVTKTITGKTRLVITALMAQTGKSAILGVTQKLQFGKASIGGSSTKNITGTARIIAGMDIMKPSPPMVDTRFASMAKIDDESPRMGIN